MKEMHETHNETNVQNDQDPASFSSTSQSKSMTEYQILSLVILSLETIIGILVNGFMMMINFVELLTRKKIGSCDLILACLGLARLSFMLLVIILYIVSYFFTDICNLQSTKDSLQYTWLFFNYISLWFAAWLCIFYCVRIVNMQLYLFVLFKTHFDRCLPVYLLASVVISASCCNSSLYSTVNSFVSMSKFGSKFNMTSSFILGGSDFATFSGVSVVGSIPPFLLFCVAAALVVGSIMKHTRKMKGQERTGYKQPSLSAHCKAVKAMITFFIFFLLYMVAFNLYLSGIFNDGISSCFCSTFIGAYPSIHSVFLVVGNRKLKHMFLIMLQKMNLYRPVLTQIETIST